MSGKRERIILEFVGDTSYRRMLGRSIIHLVGRSASCGRRFNCLAPVLYTGHCVARPVNVAPVEEADRVKRRERVSGYLPLIANTGIAARSYYENRKESNPLSRNISEMQRREDATIKLLHASRQIFNGGRKIFTR